MSPTAVGERNSFRGNSHNVTQEQFVCTGNHLTFDGGVTVSDNRVLVPVSETRTVRQTVEYAVRTVLEDGPGHIRFVFVHPTAAGDDMEQATDPASNTEEAEGLLNRISVWAQEDAGDHAEELTVDTDFVGKDQLLFSPEDVAEALVADADENGIGRIILDPEYDPGIGSPLLRPLESELRRFDSLQIEEAPVARKVRRTPLVVRSTPLQIGALFGISFIFYQLLAGTISAFDLITGTISATIVAVGLSRVTFSQDPTRRSLVRLVRHVVYIPYLLWEIIKSNILIAAVILHPRLPIDPRLTRIRPAVWGALPVTTLANSITLTPGTLTVRVDGEQLVIHTLVPGAREDLFDGGLERAVRFVFYGRKAMSIPSPRERGDTEILQSGSESETTDPTDDAEENGGESE